MAFGRRLVLAGSLSRPEAEGRGFAIQDAKQSFARAASAIPVGMRTFATRGDEVLYYSWLGPQKVSYNAPRMRFEVSFASE